MFHTRRWATVAATLVSIGWPSLSLAATLNVPGDFATIQACIDAAVSGVDECVVSPGTYHETINFLGKAITLRSFGGSDVTTIDATGIGGSVVTCANGEGPNTVLDGFTVTGGAGSDAFGNGYRYGGGMFNAHSDPTVTNCTFSGNTAYAGGGMYSDNNSSPTVVGCSFVGNMATGYGNGGGMYNYDSSPKVADCAFSDNTATGRGGGGMYNDHFSSPTVTNCLFSDNRATLSQGGGMHNYNGSNPTVINSTFSGNAAYFGGGMYNNLGSRPTVTDCNFKENTAYEGGGMNNDGAGGTFTNCTFTGNNSTSLGGGVYNWGGTPTLRNCVFRRNTGAGGAGMYNGAHSDLTLSSCTFVGNRATFGGGGMFNYWCNPTITGCTFSMNKGSSGGAMVNQKNLNHGDPSVTNCTLWGNIPNEIVNPVLFNEYSAPIIRFSDVQGGLPSHAVDGGGNIDLDPMFVRPPDPGPDGAWDGVEDDYGDLRLQAGSPCIDTGDPAFVTEPGETDLEGHARVLCEYVDMGAYEFGIGDYDCDQRVDLTDFASWSSCMTGPLQSAIGNRQSAIPCEAFDFDGDGDVDLGDFAAFQRVLTAP